MFAPEQLAEARPLVIANGDELIALDGVASGDATMDSGGPGSGKPSSGGGALAGALASTKSNTAARARKKSSAAAAANVRNWLRVDEIGETSMMMADKYRLTHKLGVQGRDLRIMDPSLATSYPSAILCRDRALVVSLEHIKACLPLPTPSSSLLPAPSATLPVCTHLSSHICLPVCLPA
jgi:hypothetical protein